MFCFDNQSGKDQGEVEFIGSLSKSQLTMNRASLLPYYFFTRP
jgi:hypothetical protein